MPDTETPTLSTEFLEQLRALRFPADVFELIPAPGADEHLEAARELLRKSHSTGSWAERLTMNRDALEHIRAALELDTKHATELLKAQQ